MRVNRIYLRFFNLNLFSHLLVESDAKAIDIFLVIAVFHEKDFSKTSFFQNIAISTSNNLRLILLGMAFYEKTWPLGQINISSYNSDHVILRQRSRSGDSSLIMHYILSFTYSLIKVYIFESFFVYFASIYV